MTKDNAKEIKMMRHKLGQILNQPQTTQEEKVLLKDMIPNFDPLINLVYREPFNRNVI